MASQLIPITIPAPGVKGLNLQELSSLQGPEWCRVGYNLIIDSTGRIATRPGWQKTHTTALSGTPDVEQVFEYKPNTGSNVSIFSAGTKIYKDETTPTDITPTVAPTNGNWKFQNFNGNMVGYQAGENPIIWKGSGLFTLLSAEASSAGIVQSNEVLSAWGRTWVVDPIDNTTLRYSDLLRPQDFTNGSAGYINLQQVWTRGQDKIIALAAFNNQLVIFGKDTTTVYSNADDVNNLSLAEVIYDVGCVARDSVQYIDEDIFFLSRTGVRSFKRTLLRDKMPEGDISKNVRDDIVGNLAAEDVDKVRSVYSKALGAYLLSFPTIGTTYYFDIKKYVSSQEIRVFKWNSINPTALFNNEDGSTLAGFTGGWVGTISGESDNGEAYIVEYQSGWTDMATLLGDMSLSARLVMLKKYQAVLTSNNTINPLLAWNFDQNDSGLTRQINFPAGSRSEYNISEYGIDEYGAGSTAYTFSVNTSGSGRTFSFGIKISVLGASAAYQYANIMFKLGRIT